MGTHALSASALIEAPPQDVYATIADYTDGHKRIIPKPPFVALEVEHGGVGAGTRIRVQLRVLGSVQTYTAEVTEPEPGRVLTETSDTGYATSFIVDPRADGRHSYVTISTEIERDGLLAAIEARLMARLLRPVYLRELEQLEAVASTRMPERGPV